MSNLLYIVVYYYGYPTVIPSGLESNWRPKRASYKRQQQGTVRKYVYPSSIKQLFNIMWYIYTICKNKAQ